MSETKTEKVARKRIAQDVSDDAFNNLVSVASENKVRKSLVIECLLLTATPESVKAAIEQARPRMVKTGSRVARRELITQLRSMTTEQLQKLLEEGKNKK